MARLLVLLVPLGLMLGLLNGADRPPAPRPLPKLVVVVYFDQLRGDYLSRWADLFGDDGFKRLTTNGAWFTDCHYPYAVTTTGPGHASVLSGCGGAVHGIINNEWYDRPSGEMVYCAADDRYQFVPPPVVSPNPAEAKEDTRKKPKQAGNPKRMLAETVADRVKAAGGRVFGLSLKDRSAIFPAGKQPDGAYWFTGQFVTSTYYRDTLPPWVQQFNASRYADQWAGRRWGRLRGDVDYDKRSGPDDGPGEGTGRGQGKTFPHPFPAAVSDSYFEAVANSPAGNEVLLAFAKACLAGEKLGGGDRPDLLTVSFSSNDLIGHTWGPDSHEVLDITLRSDRLMADLLRHLDGRCGPDGYAVILTADHGVCPMPPPDKRVRPRPLVLAAERFLQDTFGKPGGEKGSNTWLEKLSPPHVYLNHRLLAAKGINPDDMAEKLARWLETQPGIEAVLTRKAILSPDKKPVPFGDAVRACYHPDRGGDVFAVTKPLWTFDDDLIGTTHGTPHEYDTHVPLVVYAPGAGVPGGPRGEKVTPLHAAAVAGKLLGVGPPAQALYPVPATLFGK